MINGEGIAAISNANGIAQISETIAAVKALGAVVQQFSPQRLALPDEPPSARMPQRSPQPRQPTFSKRYGAI
jgi:hypothetical protein